MTPKEKARKLVIKFGNIDSDSEMFDGFKMPLFYAQRCALIAVEEMLGEYQLMSDLESIIVINDEVKFVVHQLVYWIEVKKEIHNL